MSRTWNEQFANNEMKWPIEMLARMLKGRSFPRCDIWKNDFTKQSILDVGCGDANNFPLYQQVGFKRICGVEITQEIVDLNLKRLKSMGINADMRVGTNDTIPYDEEFDFLVSWNAGYYMGTEKDFYTFDTYLREFSRVLKQGGIFIFSIPMCSHVIFKKSEDIDEKYTIIRNDPLDIRNGIVMRKFKGEEEIRSELSPYFERIEFGSIRDNYFGEDDAHWHIGYCYKK